MLEKKEFYTVMEFAEKLRVHPNTIRKGLKSGRIQAVRTGSGKGAYYRIPDTEVQRLCEMDMTKLIENIVDRKFEEKKRNHDDCMLDAVPYMTNGIKKLQVEKP
ncbi:MAG TPA: excisionase family DNA-binding protein [Rhabdochlamydiaceae bacterium]